MNEAAASPNPEAPRGVRSHARGYLGFLRMAAGRVTRGSPGFWIWTVGLLVVVWFGVDAWAKQVEQGMGVTGMTDHVSWGLYIANFTFLVGLAAGGVMMVIPAYLYRDKDLHETVILGELLAIAAIVMCLLFVVVDLGRPDRALHLVPWIGEFHFPSSLMSWDVIALNGYLLLNAHVCGYLLYKRYRGETPGRGWYLPLVVVGIAWAISIHTVTAFIYCGLGGRPFWNTALMAPRFLTSAFVAGPAFIILILQIARRFGGLTHGEGSIRTLTGILRVTIWINLVMLGSEVFTALYTGGSHAATTHYLYFGHDGKEALVPWMWTSLGAMLLGALILFLPRVDRRRGWLDLACVLVFGGVWIEKGMGLIVPGFVPSALHEWVEYVPTPAEWKITWGIWAGGLLLYTLMLKVALPVMTGQLRQKP